MRKLLLQIIGMIVSITALILAVVFFNWKLALIILLALWGNNIERHAKKIM